MRQRIRASWGLASLLLLLISTAFSAAAPPGRTSRTLRSQPGSPQAAAGASAGASAVGSVLAAGNNGSFQAQCLQSLRNVKQVAGGAAHALALKTDGTVWGGGDNSVGQLTGAASSQAATAVQIIDPSDPTGKLTGVKAIAAGYVHSLALKGDGTVWAWGSNGFGRLGDGTTTNRAVPTQVVGLTGVTAIAGGGNYSMALKSDGTVWTWGYGDEGQLGDGGRANHLAPVQVPGLAGVMAISAGFAHAVALRHDGTIWCWGDNTYGQVGDGSGVNRLAPVQVPVLSGIKAIAAGYYFTQALTPDGRVWGWGLNSTGTLGDGTTTNRFSPVRATSSPGVKAIAAGGYHALAVTGDGVLWSCGYNSYGQLMDGSTANTSTPTARAVGSVVSLAAGEEFTLVVRGGGTALAWGYNGEGELGDGSMTDRSAPVAVSGMEEAYAVAGGYSHSLTLRADGSVWGGGTNDRGQLGDGTLSARLSPVRVLALANVAVVSAGNRHSLALAADGTVRAWGYGLFGELGNGTTADSSTPVLVSSLNGITAISAGSLHSLALYADGTVRAWGYGQSGQLGTGSLASSSVPVTVSGLAGVIAIAAGGYHSLALKSNGTVWSWGYGGDGQLGNGSFASNSVPVAVSGLTDVVAIAGGNDYSLAVKADGTVWAWGYGIDGQLGNGSTATSSVPVEVSGLTNVVAIAGGLWHSLALKSDGSVWAWGHGSSGQLGNNSYLSSATPVRTALSRGTSIAAGSYSSYAIGGNHAPAGAGFNVSVPEDSSASIFPDAFGLDADGDALTTVLVAGTTHGTLTKQAPNTFYYYPASDYYGPDSFTFRLSDGELQSDVYTISITVTPVNDPVRFDAPVPQTVLEDAGPQAASITGISSGAANEVETLSLDAVILDPDKIASASVSYTSPNNTATINYTLVPDANGTARIAVVLVGSGNSLTQDLVINITPVNDPPFLDSSGSPHLPDINEDDTANPGVLISDLIASALPVDLITDADAGALEGIFVRLAFADHGTWQYSTDGMNWQTMNIPTAQGLALAADGVTRVRFLPAPDFDGSVSLGFRGWDRTYGVNGGLYSALSDSPAANSLSVAGVFATITVKPVNDVPTFTKGADQTVAINAGAQTITGWASAISAGPADEASQTLTFEVTNNSNPSLFSAAPSVNATGDLSYTPAADNYGSATITLRVKDNGGTANGGVDTSATQTFTITVSPLGGVSVTPSTTSIKAGKSFGISWTAPNGRPLKDWVALASSSQYNATTHTLSGYVAGSYLYTNAATAGTHTFTLPSSLASGTYYCVYLDNDTNMERAASGPVTITAAAAPTVSVNNPGSVGPYTGTPLSVSLSATAADEDGAVAKVEFFVGSTKIGEDTTPDDGFTTTWSVTSAATYSLTAKATDNDGFSTTSAAVPVIVGGAVNVTVTPGATTTTAGAAFKISWTAPAGRPARDWVALVRSDNYDSTGKTISNYVTGSWTYTNGATTGTHNFTVPSTIIGGTYYCVYLDNNSTSVLGVSSAVTINAPIPPTVTVSDPGAVSPYTGTPLSVSLSATAADEDGTVAKVEFFVNGAKIGEDTTAGDGFTTTWTINSGGTYSLTGKATDNGGNTTTSSAVSVTVGGAVAPTVAGSATSVAAGSSFTINWTAPPGRPAKDWVALVNAAQYNSVSNSITGYVSGSWVYTGGSTKGSHTFTVPAGQVSGTYYCVYLSNDTAAVLAVSSAVSVTASVGSTITITPSTTTATRGTNFKMSWTASSGRPTKDWVAFVRADQYNSGTQTISGYVSGSWVYTGGNGSGTHSFTLPAGISTGTYYCVYLNNDTTAVLAISSAVTVN